MRALTVLPFLATLASMGARADAVDCNGGVVFIGQGAVDLLVKCGEPSFREERVEERSILLLDSSQQVSEVQKIRVQVARWTYDFGSARLLQFVTLENGRIVAVRRGGYGSATAPPRPERVSVTRCDPQRSFHLGDSAYEVLSRCGYPAARDSTQMERQVSAAGAEGILYGDAAIVDVETWTYNFGAGTLQRRLEFIDGRLVGISTGTYGYD
jgi:hypothetical protein